ncbi:MAG: hypothetical protein R3A52_30790 [Polyangiales bacterium]
MSLHYRDSLDAVLLRIPALRDELRALEDDLGPAVLRALDGERVSSLERLRRATEVHTRTLDDARALWGALETYRDALRALASELPAIDRAWSALPDDFTARSWPLVDDVARVFAPDSPELREVSQRYARRVARWVESVDPHFGAVADGAGQPGWRATLRARGVPMVFDGWMEEGRGILQRGCVEPCLALATSVRRGAPRARLRPEQSAELLARVIRRAHGSYTGDRTFDAFFVLEGDADAQRWFMDEPLRRSLLLIAGDDVPTLEVESGVATLRWRFEPRPATMEAAVAVLAAVRQAPALPLRKG